MVATHDLAAQSTGKGFFLRQSSTSINDWGTNTELVAEAGVACAAATDLVGHGGAVLLTGNEVSLRTQSFVGVSYQ